MPTVLDSLIVEFALDPTKFSAGQKQILEDARKLEEAAKKGARETESQSIKITEAFQNAKRQAIEIIGAFAGAKGIGDFLRADSDQV